MTSLSPWSSMSRWKRSALQAESFLGKFGDSSSDPRGWLLGQVELEFVQQDRLIRLGLSEARHHQPAPIGRR